MPSTAWHKFPDGFRSSKMTGKMPVPPGNRMRISAGQYQEPVPQLSNGITTWSHLTTNSRPLSGVRAERVLLKPWRGAGWKPGASAPGMNRGTIRQPDVVMQQAPMHASRSGYLSGRHPLNLIALMIWFRNLTEVAFLIL